MDAVAGIQADSVCPLCGERLPKAKAPLDALATHFQTCPKTEGLPASKPGADGGR